MGPWVGSEAQNVSADICAARLGYHTAAAACHPPHPLIHIETWEYCTDTHTHSLSLTPTVFFLRFVSTFLVHSFQFYRAIFAHKQTHTCAHTHTLSHAHSHSSWDVFKHTFMQFYSFHLAVFLPLLFHTFTLCLCQFYLSCSIKQVLHCSLSVSLLPHSLFKKEFSKLVFQFFLYFYFPLISYHVPFVYLFFYLVMLLL